MQPVTQPTSGAHDFLFYSIAYDIIYSTTSFFADLPLGMPGVSSFLSERSFIYHKNMCNRNYEYVRIGKTGLKLQLKYLELIFEYSNLEYTRNII